MSTDLQFFAITFLLCAPSDLHQAWISSDDPDDWKAALAKIRGLRDTDRAFGMMQKLAHRRAFFEGIAQLLADTEEYTEIPPHPSLAEAEAMMAKLV
jgi:hypothetical protein